MITTGIPTQYIAILWPQVKPLLERALARAKDSATIDDVLRMAFERKATLWAVTDGDKVVAAIATKKQEDRLWFWLCGGKRLKEWAPRMREIIEPWAKAEGCKTMECAGRSGWARALGMNVRRDGTEDGMPHFVTEIR